MRELIKEHLYREKKEFKVADKIHTKYILTVDDGYCFYDIENDYYDENNNLFRDYMRKIIIPDTKKIDDYIVVEITDNMRIA